LEAFHGDGYEPTENKATVALFGRIAPIREKAIANRAKRAHGCGYVRSRAIPVAADQGGRPVMTMRSRRQTITFGHPFRIKGIDRELPAGAYDVVTDEEMIEGLSFASFRRVATMIMVPAAAQRSAALEMISISAVDLADAQRNDVSVRA
jgi:hypothetical protein